MTKKFKVVEEEREGYTTKKEASWRGLTKLSKLIEDGTIDDYIVIGLNSEGAGSLIGNCDFGVAKIILEHALDVVNDKVQREQEAKPKADDIVDTLSEVMLEAFGEEQANKIIDSLNKYMNKKLGKDK